MSLSRTNNDNMQQQHSDSYYDSITNTKPTWRPTQLVLPASSRPSKGGEVGGFLNVDPPMLQYYKTNVIEANFTEKKSG